MQPKLQWYVKDDQALTPKKEHYAGSYAPEQTMELEIRVWNNRFGTEPAGSIENPVLVFYFDTMEDSGLLKLCQASVDGGSFKEPDIIDKKAYMPLNRQVLKGEPNEGLDSDTDNYVDLNISFDFSGAQLKPSDLKNLYLEIVSQ